MALSELLRTLEDEARHRIDGILGGARADADRIVRESEAEQTRNREAELAVRETALRASAAREIEAARRTAARRVLEARAGTLERIRTAVSARIAARAADLDLAPRLRLDLAEGMGYLGSSAAILECDPSLVEAIREDARAHDLTLVPVEGQAGIVLRTADGSLEVDASLASRLEQMWPALAIELVRRLEAS